MQDKPQPTLTIRSPGRKPIRMGPGGQVRIGRHASNDLVFNDGTVSRFHATITWDPHDDCPSIEDHGSANGVEVDGRLIEGRSPLPGGNQVLIGDHMLALEITGQRASRKFSPGATTSDFFVNTDSESLVLFSEKAADEGGRIQSQQELHRLLLDLEDKGRTGTFTLRNQAITGSATFCAGKIISAEYDDSPGILGLRKMVFVSSALYQFKKAIRPDEQALDISVKKFLENEMAEGTKKLKLGEDGAQPAD